MDGQGKSIDRLLHDMRERAKELNCLYQVEELLSRTDLPLDDVFSLIIKAVPPGYQYPDVCQVRIVHDGRTWQEPDHRPPACTQSADIMVQDRKVGRLEVSYTADGPPTDRDPFLVEERRLLDTIAERIGQTILHRNLEQVSREWQTAQKDLTEKNKTEWMVIVDLLRRTDQSLYVHLGRKMVYHLIWNGVNEARELLRTLSKQQPAELGDQGDDTNRPSQKKSLAELLALSDDTFRIAATWLTDEEILFRIQKWIEEDKASFLSRAINNIDLPLVEIINAITHYHYLTGGTYDLSPPMEKGLRVSLIRRFLSDQLEFINIAKNHIEVRHFYDLIHRIIYPANGYGRLGGKSAGLFLAQKILSQPGVHAEALSELRYPKTWYITTDAIISFLSYNNLEEVNEQKYKEIDQVRLEYPNVVQLFKNSRFPTEILHGLSIALDDLGDKPLIVRSSSLLEDRIGTAFSGKYRSLFLANRGTKQERLDALTDAIAEVYASLFGPDPIEYRAERGLLDFHEEMGIMIQEVVGERVGDYYFPAFAGVAFSNNEFRWSPRIKREDGLARIVPGLGTRAVDRLSDDYPVLIAPGVPNLRVNVTADETMRYSPKRIDVINLKTGTFETKELPALLKECGRDYPNIGRIVSSFEGDHFRIPSAVGLDFDKQDLFVTFEGLITRTPFVGQLQTILTTLQERIQTPVDIEFAADATHLYLLQCRPQSSTAGNVASPIPSDVPRDQVVFSANRYVSNGKLPDITHIVYVDPDQYALLETPEDMLEIGRAVGKLNSVLPKRQFVLMGPGRWGSRGDIRLGVPVTYSDFNNTAALIEIARKKGNYVPELSFGTHFFQDLVESSIRYIPLYPDDPGVAFNEPFLLGSQNYLAEILPECAPLARTLRVIDVPHCTGGKILRILMNADQGEALGFLAVPAPWVDEPTDRRGPPEAASEDHSQWRLRMAERLASQLDGERFGVRAMYVFGSTKNATATPGSDIDLLMHFHGTARQKQQLELWLEGWSLCLAAINFSRTGCESKRLLDYHLLTDEDFAKKTGYTLKIGAATDAARSLALKRP